MLVDEDTEEKKTYQIVGDQEADVKIGPHLDLVADRPRADRQGSRRAIEVNAPGGARGYEIVKVRFG